MTDRKHDATVEVEFLDTMEAQKSTKGIGKFLLCFLVLYAREIYFLRFNLFRA